MNSATATPMWTRRHPCLSEAYKVPLPGTIQFINKTRQAIFSKSFPLLSGLLGYGVFVFSKSWIGTIGMILVLGSATIFFLYVAFSIDVLESIKNRKMQKVDGNFDSSNEAVVDGGGCCRWRRRRGWRWDDGCAAGWMLRCEAA